VFWALFWFFSACAFAAGVNAIKDAADLNILVAEDGAFYDACVKQVCNVTNAKYATLTVAIVSLSLTQFFHS